MITLPPLRRLLCGLMDHGVRNSGRSPCRKALPVHVEEGILALEKIYINGGRRGYLVGIAPQVLVDVLNARPVHCALDE